MGAGRAEDGAAAGPAGGGASRRGLKKAWRSAHKLVQCAVQS